MVRLFRILHELIALLAQFLQLILRLGPLLVPDLLFPVCFVAFLLDSEGDPGPLLLLLLLLLRFLLGPWSSVLSGRGSWGGGGSNPAGPS